MAVGNTYQRGYPSHGMTGGHDSVTSDVNTSSCHKSDETFSTAVLCRRSDKLRMRTSKFVAGTSEGMSRPENDDLPEKNHLGKPEINMIPVSRNWTKVGIS